MKTVHVILRNFGRTHLHCMAYTCMHTYAHLLLNFKVGKDTGYMAE